MLVVKETEKAILMSREGVEFWVQKRWLKAAAYGWELTKAGWKAYHIAAREQARHGDYDALKEFGFVRDTEKAVLLRCVARRIDGAQTNAEFWLPKAMTGNYKFVQAKMLEVENDLPPGYRVMWSGNK